MELYKLENIEQRLVLTYQNSSYSILKTFDQDPVDNVSSFIDASVDDLRGL